MEVLKYPDPRLREKSVPVPKITQEIRDLAQDMLETMYHSKGVGLAAPQVGRNLRMLVMDHRADQEEKAPRVLINPVLEPNGELIVSEQEGCLSVPLNYRADVNRYDSVRLRGMNIDGSEIDEVLDGLPAIIVQHETDHLDGKLFIDKISHLRRSMYDGKVKKWLSQKKDA